VNPPKADAIELLRRKTLCCLRQFQWLRKEPSVLAGWSLEIGVVFDLNNVKGIKCYDSKYTLNGHKLMV
jgi:hypothetical protein